MRIIKTRLFLHWKDLQDRGVPFKTIDSGTQRHKGGFSKSWECIKDPDDNRYNLIAFDTIPEATLHTYNLPTAEDLIEEHRHAQLIGMVRKDPLALDYYLADSRTSDKAHELQEIAAWFMLAVPANKALAISLGYSDTLTPEGKKLTPLKNLYLDIIDHLIKSNTAWSITTLDKFIRKMSPFKSLYDHQPALFDPSTASYYMRQAQRAAGYEEALESLISAKHGKRNAAKIKVRQDSARGARQSRQMQDVIIGIYADGAKKPSFEETWFKYMAIAREKYELWQKEADQEVPEDQRRGWDKKCILRSVKSIENILTDSRQTWYEKRHGIKEYNDKYRVITHRERASFANAKWIIDGTPLHFGYVDNSGSLYSRFNVFFVMDEHTRAIVGYSISTKGETELQVLAALRHACQTTGKMPHEIQMDNSSAIKSINTQRAIALISDYQTPARPGNARAKMIEGQFFPKYNKRILSKYPGYLGNPFGKSLDSRPNLEAIQQQIKNGLLPDFDQALANIEDSITVWNNHELEGTTPMAVYNQSVQASADRQRQFTHMTDVSAFWYQPSEKRQQFIKEGGKKKSQTVLIPREFEYKNTGIIIMVTDVLTGTSKPKIYQFDDPAINEQMIGERFTLRIHPDQHDHAYLYRGDKLVTDGGAPLILSEARKYHSARVDHQPGELGEIMSRERSKDHQRQISRTRLAEINERNDETGDLQLAPLFANSLAPKSQVNASKSALYESINNPRLEVPAQGPTTPSTDDHQPEDHTEASAPAIKKEYQINRLS